jgi:hypothetical protein
MHHVDALRSAFDRTKFTAKDTLDRFLHEVGFAEGLCTLHPKRKRPWTDLIARASA